MTTPCPTTEAFNYGCANHDGFFLVLTMNSGHTVRGAAYVPKDGIIRIDNTGVDNNPPRFIRLADVSVAQTEEP